MSDRRNSLKVSYLGTLANQTFIRLVRTKSEILRGNYTRFPVKQSLMISIDGQVCDQLSLPFGVLCFHFLFLLIVS